MRGRSWWLRLAGALGALALCVGLVACGESEEGAEGEGGGGGDVALTLGYVTPPAHPYGQAVDFFVAEVEEASGGSITFETIPTYSGGDVPLLQAVRDGTVDAATVSTAVWATQGVEVFDALQAPFLIDRVELEREVIAGEIGQEMLAEVGQIGLVGLAIHEGGLRKPIGADMPLTSPEDFEGLAIRSVESEVLATGLRALGADPVPLPVGDIYAALRDGTVDALESNLPLIQTNRYYEVAEFITGNLTFWPFPTALVINQDVFDSLSEEQQQILIDAGARVPDFSIDIFTQPSDLPETLCEEGMRFAQATEAEIAALEERAQVAVAQLSENPQTAGFIERIRQIKEEGYSGPPPSPDVPESCVVGSS